MERKMVIQIGYEYFAFSPADALLLLEISDRGFKVEQEHYNKPYKVVGAAELITRAEMVDIISFDTALERVDPVNIDEVPF